jgi:hypothetical protein
MERQEGEERGRQNEKVKKRIANYSQLLEEARYRDRLLVEEFSMCFLGTAALLNLAYYIRDILPAQIAVTFIGIIGLFALAFSLSRIAETREACWEQAEKIEKEDKDIGELNVRHIIRNRKRTYPLARLGWKKTKGEWKLVFDVGRLLVYFVLYACLPGWVGVNVFWMIC